MEPAKGNKTDNKNNQIDIEGKASNLRCEITESSSTSIKEKREIGRVIIWNVSGFERRKVSKVKPI